MQNDPIIEELHAVREAIAKESEEDIRKIAEAAKLRQSQSKKNVVQLPPRKVKFMRKAS